MGLFDFVDDIVDGIGDVTEEVTGGRLFQDTGTDRLAKGVAELGISSVAASELLDLIEALSDD